MKTLLLTAFIALTTISFAQDSDKAFEKDILKLMKITNSGDLGMQALDQMIGMYSEMGIPDKFWEEFRKEISAGQLEEMVVPIYMKHFTHEDVLGLIEFYKSPLGKKMIEKQPLILQETMMVGQEWGRSLAERIIFRMREEGYME